MKNYKLIYFRTKRKRDNSSQGARSESPVTDGHLPASHPGHPAHCNGHTGNTNGDTSLPPWCDPDYPYSRGIIG